MHKNAVNAKPFGDLVFKIKHYFHEITLMCLVMINHNY